MSFIRAKKSLGQHFLNSPSVLAKIIAAAKIQPGETILEIGPGTGVLTKALLEATGSRSDIGTVNKPRVITVEKDHVAFEFLKIRFDEAIRAGRLKLIEGDILDPRIDTQLSSSIDSSPADSAASDFKFALVANIPYYITGAILEKFLEYGPRPDRMVLLVQKEVAERIVARPISDKKKSDGRNVSGKESILSISVKAFGTPHIVATVPRGAFSPAPTVDSAILAIEDISDKNFALFNENLASNDSIMPSNKDISATISRFFDVVRAGFAHKRKFLIRNLETVVSQEMLRTIWPESRLDEKVRPEDLAVQQWFELFSLIS